jgi:hypothetical protein
MEAGSGLVQRWIMRRLRAASILNRWAFKDIIMNDYEIVIYIDEAYTQCKFVLNARRALSTLINNYNDARSKGDIDGYEYINQEIFRNIHSLLTHASNVSKLFWPGATHKIGNEVENNGLKGSSNNPRNIRAKELREYLSIPDKGHKLEKRNLRNHLEHYDERLDDWQLNSPNKNFIQDSIGTRNMLKGVDDKDVFRWFDPSTNIMYFRGETFNLNSIIEGIEDIIRRIERKDSFPWRRVVFRKKS